MNANTNNENNNELVKKCCIQFVKDPAEADFVINLCIHVDPSEVQKSMNETAADFLRTLPL